MRLINVNTLDLEEFMGEPGNGVPPYAILSHTWGQQEVSFRQMTGDHAALTELEGFRKIVECCAKVESDGHQYLWIDTCCIDKSGSAELSEAINSMFRWYQKATICYAYLNDDSSLEDPVEESSSFRRSRWFKRGWTLQELLAPPDVIFFSKDWLEIGTKHSLSKIISEITKIDQTTLISGSWSHTSIACKMSWASSRETTRVEDMAYCLMGLFDVNMPLIYGEGKKAFYRLQLEIMKLSDDQTIFAWLSRSYSSRFSGLLAESPDDFRKSHNIISNASIREVTISYDISKQYIRLETVLLQLFKDQESSRWGTRQLNPDVKSPDTTRDVTSYLGRGFESGEKWRSSMLAVLRCEDELGYIVIPICKLDSGELVRLGGDRWLRTSTREGPSQNIFVRALKAQGMGNKFLPDYMGIETNHSQSDIRVQSLSISGSGYYISSGYPPNFVAAPGERPKSSEAISRINKALSFISPIVIFFAHEQPGDHPPFALRFDRHDHSWNSREYHIRCRVGPSIKDWDKFRLFQAENRDDDIVDLDSQVPLSESTSIFIQSRKVLLAPPVNNVVTQRFWVRIYLGAPLPWQRK